VGAIIWFTKKNFFLSHCGSAINAGLDGCVQFYIACGHPIQNQVPHYQVNQKSIQNQGPNDWATEFESVNDSLGGTIPKFELYGCIQYKLGCNHPSQLLWQHVSASY
jgi:hypothetical protein